MSTKIYHGYRFKSGNIIDVNQALNEIGIAYDGVAKRYLTALTAGLITEAWDAQTLCHRPGRLDEEHYAGLKDHSMFWWATNKISDEQREIRRTGRRNPVYDFQLDVVIFPEPDVNFTVAMLFTENPLFKKVFVEHPMVEEYPYWDNSDRPDELTDEQWEARKQHYERLVGDDPVSRRGLMRSYESPFTLAVTPAEVVAAFATKEQRAAVTAREILTDTYCNSRSAAAKAKAEQQNSSAPVMAMLREAKRWIEENNDRFLEQVALILPRLTNPTEEQIRKWPEAKGTDPETPKNTEPTT